ncbi:MAG: ABC transporter permease, partial [Prevotellaceae bacterium]|nr:ABC transporter permease [Prevotellaceae bacterium]
IWRNIWRNRRRTIITVASIFFAVLLCSLTTSLSDGIWEKTIDNTLRTQTGHIQVHGKGYWGDKIIDNFMAVDAETIARLKALENVENVSPRVETFAMASFGLATKGVALIGVSPEQEAAKSSLPLRLVRGDYLSETDNGVLIGEGLSRYLKADVGDTLALIGQGYHGASAAGLFPIRGVLTLITADMDNGVAYMTLPAAQQLIGMPNGYSGILIALKDDNRLDKTMHSVERVVDTSLLEVYPWRFTMERLLQTSAMDKAFDKALLYILYVIVGFGIVGAVIMLTNERKREFRMLVSLGMHRARLAGMMGMELLAMSLLGVAAALAIAVPVAYALALNPIELTGEVAEIMYKGGGMEPVLPTSTNAAIFIRQAAIILAITAAAAIYPVRKIWTLKLVEK